MQCAEKRKGGGTQKKDNKTKKTHYSAANYIMWAF